MIYIATALYCEAKPWILAYSLKKDDASNKFQLFSNDNIHLIITKTGKLNAAIAITELFCHYPPCSQDILLNVGIAAGTDLNLPIGSGYLCNRITDTDTGRTSYPDLIFKHSFTEASLITVSKPITLHNQSVISDNTPDDALSFINKTTEKITAITLYDMEATGIYTAASLHLKQHQMLFYKVLSDHGLEETLSPDDVTNLLAKRMPELMQYVDSIIQASTRDKNYEFTEQERLLMQTLCDSLHFSVTMSYQLRQLLLYMKLRGQNLVSYLTKQLEELAITPCNSKTEGKKYFERIQTELL